MKMQFLTFYRIARAQHKRFLKTFHIPSASEFQVDACSLRMRQYYVCNDSRIIFKSCFVGVVRNKIKACPFRLCVKNTFFLRLTGINYTYVIWIVWISRLDTCFHSELLFVPYPLALISNN